jgi:hypothetical protein
VGSLRLIGRLTNQGGHDFFPEAQNEFKI